VYDNVVVTFLSTILSLVACQSTNYRGFEIQVTQYIVVHRLRFFAFDKDAGLYR
jgi:hypothetical protein